MNTHQQPSKEWKEQDPTTYPTKLKELGVWLADKLDDDDWNTVEPMLHAVAALLTSHSQAIRERVKDDIRLHGCYEGCKCRRRILALLTDDKNI